MPLSLNGGRSRAYPLRDDKGRILPVMPPWSTIGELVRGRAKSQPDQVNIVIDGKALSYRQLDERSDRVAAHLHASGVRKGQRVACLMYNCVEQFLVWIATVKLGAIWVPLNVSLIGADLAYTIEDCDPAALFVDEDNEAKLAEIPDRKLMVKVGRQTDARFTPFEHLLSDIPAHEECEVAGTDPAVIIYTGGTTGMPKGVVLPHFAWIAAGMRYCEALHVRSDDRHYSVLTMFHIGGLMAGLIGPITAGIPTTLDRWFSASAFWSRVGETKATIIDPIGTMLAVLAKAEPHAAERDHDVRVMLGAFGQLPPATIARYAQRFRLSFLNLYSLTEAGGLIIVNNPPDSPRPHSNGRSSRWVEIMVADDRGAPMPAGIHGEILLRPRIPNTFMSGYHNNPQRTVEVFRNLWLHTGDVGYLDEEGYLYFTGRQAHFLRRRGENISAHEVEALIQDYPGIAEVAIVGVLSEFGDDDVKAFIIPEQGQEIDPAALFHWCRERMSYFKLPRYIECVDEFPRSATKREVERHKLKARSNDAAWDAESVLGRITSTDSRRR
jgi:crotonobetaine/carnitine-CoA ligase